jgi:hypothetical protein
MMPLHELELRRDVLRVRSAILRRRISVQGNTLAAAVAPAERAVVAAGRVVRSPAFIAGALVFAFWLGPRKLAHLAGRAVMGVAVVRRALSLARGIR